MAFSGMVLTTKGVGLLAKVQAGATLTFTKLKVGDGTLASPATLEALNDLISPKLVVGIGSVDVPSAGLCRIRGTLNNSELESGFFVREIGAFANDPDLGEILYAVANAGAECDYLPAGGGAVAIEQVMDVILSIGSAANVTAVIDGSLYATKGELDSHNTDPSAHALPDLYLPLAGGTMTGAINEAKGADIASADTCDIGAATGNYVQITGTATINSFGTAPAGTVRRLRFLAALTLTHNATSLILPEGANITTVPGDIYEFTSEGGGNWRMTGYMPASGKYNPVVASASVVGGVKRGSGVTIAADGTISAAAYVVATGTVADGGTIPLPSGCSSHAGIIVSPNAAPTARFLADIEEGGAAVGFGVSCSVDQTTRIVSCAWHASYSYSWGRYSGTANYLILGVV